MAKNWLEVLKAYTDTLETALGNPTGDMSAVAQSEASTLAAYLLHLRAMQRAHAQCRICLIVPDLANIATDEENKAIKAELDKVGTVSYLDQAGVDDGNEDWNVYDLVVVGSNAHGTAFTTTNLDDLINLKVPILVCNDDVAIFLKMGTVAASQSSSDATEYCESIYNRVMYRVFTTVGDKTIFSEAAVSDRLDMSDDDLAEQVLMVDEHLDPNTLVVLGWLPMETAVGAINLLTDKSELPAGRVFGGCFYKADKLNALGQKLLRTLARNLTQASITPSISLKAQASKVNDIDKDLGEPNDTTTDTLHGKIGTDTEMADHSLYDLLGGLAFKTHALSAMLGALTATDNLVDILGGYTTAASLKDSIDDIVGYLDTEIAAIEGKLDLPTVDETANTKIGEVIGQKGDAANVTASQASVIGLLRAVITTYLADGAIGLAQLQSEIADIETKLDTPATFKATGFATPTNVTDAHSTTDGKVDNVKTETALIKTETDQLPNVEHETEWASTPTIQALADATATALTAGVITPTYPTGATRVRAILIATIHVANKTAVAHHIKFKIEGKKAEGAYADQLDLTAQEGLSMVDVDGATDGWSGAIDVTTLVNASGEAYSFRFEVDSDNAANVIYTCGFVLTLVYTM